MLRSHFKNVFSSSVATALVIFDISCGTIAGNPPRPDDEPESNTSRVVELSLLEPDFFSEINGRIVSAAKGQYKDGELDDRKSANVSDGRDLKITESIVNWPTRAAGELLRVLSAVEDLVQAIFGKEGYFGGSEVTFDSREEEKIFKIDGKNDLPSVVVFRLNSETSEYRFTIELYYALSAGRLDRRTLLELAPYDQGGARVKFLHKLNAGEGTQRIDLRYDTKLRTVAAHFGDESPSVKKPAKTVIQLEIEDINKSVNLSGGIIWRMPEEVESTWAPRHYSLRDGDIEIFRSSMKLGSDGFAAQELAFLPVDRSIDLTKESFNSLFEDFNYPGFGMQFLTHLIRDLDLNPSCDNSGKKFRDAIVAAEVELATGDIPDDLCAENVNFTDSRMVGLLNEICLAGINIDIELNLDGATKIPICDRRSEYMLLQNPHFFQNIDRQRVLVIHAAELSAEHKVLAEKLEDTDAVDFGSLTSPGWEPTLTVDRSDFLRGEE